MNSSARSYYIVPPRLDRAVWIPPHQLLLDDGSILFPTVSSDKGRSSSTNELLERPFCRALGPCRRPVAGTRDTRFAQAIPAIHSGSHATNEDYVVGAGR